MRTQGQVYDRIGYGYADLRRPDQRIGAHIAKAIGTGTVLNVGAGAGSYELSSTVAAVEPSAVMVAQRRVGSAPAVRAVAEALPFRDHEFDASMAVLTTHHWTSAAAGLAEMARVSQRQVVLTWDQAYVARSFWFVTDYLPEVAEAERDLAAYAAVSGAWPDARVEVVPVPWDCTDGFFAAYWRRPEEYLRHEVRAAISAFAFQPPERVATAVAHLSADLADGTWDARHGHLRSLDELDCGYRLVVRG